MAYSNPILNAFSAGELSPQMEGRTDHEKYYSGCRRLENFIPRPYGSVSRRQGTEYIMKALSPAGPERLLNFDFNATASQSYVLELGAGKMRFFTRSGVVLDSQNDVYELDIPWRSEFLKDIRTAQNGNELYMVCESTPPYVLRRFSHSSWTLEPLSLDWPGADWVVRKQDDSFGTGRAGESFVLPEYSEFRSNMVLKVVGGGGVERWYMYVGNKTFQTGMYPRVISFEESPGESSTDDVESILNADGKLNVSAWTVGPEPGEAKPSQWGAMCWPNFVGFYENRLVLAATYRQPQTIWMSRTGAYGDFRMNTSGWLHGSQGVPLDDDAIEHTLSGARVNPICWMTDQEHLLVGTNAFELKIWSGSELKGITPSNCQSRRLSAYGSSSVGAELVSDAVLYVSRSGRKIREMQTDTLSSRYVAPQLTLLAEHLTASGIREMAYAREPDGVLWCVRNDGELLGCTYLREENIRAWHHHALGGGGWVKSISVVPGESGDELWMVVQRMHQGRTVQIIERLVPYSEGTGKNVSFSGVYLDSWLRYSGKKVSQISGLDDMEGETLCVMADKAFLGVKPIRNGCIELGCSAFNIFVGYTYTSLLQPMRLELPLANGSSSQGRKRRVMSVMLRFLESIGGEVCSGDDRRESYEPLLPLRQEISSGPPALYHGDREVRLPGGFHSEGLFTVRQTEPFPMTILCCIPQVQVE